MGNKAIISKDNILEVAFAIASEKGLAGLGIREVADACSVSVGSVYNYFPSKAHLISEVVGRYWEQALDKNELHAKQDEDFLSFCHRLSERMEQPIKHFQQTWSGQMKSLDAQSLAVAHEEESSYFAHIEKGLQLVLMRDKTIPHEQLVGPLEPSHLCAFIWKNLLEGHRRSDGSVEVLFALLERLFDKGPSLQ